MLQADRVRVEAGEDARLTRGFDILPRGLPVAALTRQFDAGDALGFTWLRADPGSLRPDMASARLLACGDALDLTRTEADALLKPLRPLFGDEGFPISAPTPSRWFLCLPIDARLPTFVPPRAVYGDDLFACLPEGRDGQRWRRLMNEAQVLLHNHPVNADRIRAGKLPVNTLWFWGAGRLPDHVRTDFTRVSSDDVLVKALAQRAGIMTVAPGDGDAGHLLLDLRRCVDAVELEARGLQTILKRRTGRVELDFGDGLLLRWRPRHRWRVWRRREPA